MAWIRYAILLTTVAYFASCRNDISEIKAITDPQNLPVQSSYNAIYEYTVQGSLRNRLIAAQLDQYESDSGYIEASGGFEMIFFDSLQNEQARLTAVHARFYQQKNQLVAWENVQLFNLKNERLETEELIFEMDSNQIYTDKNVMIQTESATIYGKGLESNDSFTDYRILSGSGDVYINEESDSLINE